jgi:HD superfamily phosphohydrolase
MPKGSRRKKTRKRLDFPAHLVNKNLTKTIKEIKRDAKEYVQMNKHNLFKIQKTSQKIKKKNKEEFKRRVFESEKEKKKVLKLSKKIKKNKSNPRTEKVIENVLDPWADEDPNKFKSKWEDKPIMPEMEKPRNPAVMVPKSGESHNPSQAAYSQYVDLLFDKGKFLQKKLKKSGSSSQRRNRRI